MAEAALPTVPNSLGDPLRPALQRLGASLAEQRRALAAWRRSLAELAEAVDRLHAPLGLGRDGLNPVADAARRADAEARRLERTTDAWLPPTGVRPVG